MYDILGDSKNSNNCYTISQNLLLQKDGFKERKIQADAGSIASSSALRSKYSLAQDQHRVTDAKQTDVILQSTQI